ncbi:MAG: hydrolase, partial [Oscillospiraceae bacterium]|nr:hydrolase [Oscillospiraceae bacterium]
MKRAFRGAAAVFVFVMLFALILSGCGQSPEGGARAETPGSPSDGLESPVETPTPTPEPSLTPEPELDPEQPPEEEASVPLVEYDGIVEHLFFHTAIAYPELAFDGDAQEKGFDDWMVTVDEYKKILQSLYDKGYILVNMNDVWSEYTDSNGAQAMKRNTLMIPEGKKPLILSYDDISYYYYMLPEGFPYKLIVGYDGEIYSYGLDPDGKEVFSQELDAVPILDKFVEEHP